MFDIIIGNPPYQKVVGPKKTQAIWPLFTSYSLELLSFTEEEKTFLLK